MMAHKNRLAEGYGVGEVMGALVKGLSFGSLDGRPFFESSTTSFLLLFVGIHGEFTQLCVD